MTTTITSGTVTAAVDSALAFARAVTGADRCSLSVWRSFGGTDLWSLDETGSEFRHLNILSPQLSAHFAEHPYADRRRNLPDSPFASDQSLAKKGFAEVTRSPLIDADGRVFGVLNIIRTAESDRDRDVEFANRLAASLALVVAEDQPGNGPR